MRKKPKVKYCCLSLKDGIEEESILTGQKLFIYDAPMRCYGIIDIVGSKKIYQPIDYCPFCGTKFPSDLGEKWSDVIWEELGPEYLIESRAEFQKLLCKHQGKEYVPDSDLPKAKPLPVEFQTDEWWKKRGL
jgi:hypothetical protein